MSYKYRVVEKTCRDGTVNYRLQKRYNSFFSDWENIDLDSWRWLLTPGQKYLPSSGHSKERLTDFKNKIEKQFEEWRKEDYNKEVTKTRVVG